MRAITLVKRIAYLLFLPMLLLGLGVTVPPLDHNRSFAQQQRLPPTINVSRVQQDEERRRNNFKSARDLLIQKSVPFEPEELLKKGWQKKLAPVFAQMPEMQTARYGGNQLKGAQLAGTLYLPEKVRITGDTIILAKRVVFEGRNPIIKGNYNISFMPIETDGALGTTLDVAMKQQGIRFAHASYENPLLLKKFVPTLLTKDWSLTIDTSGEGRKEWLEKQKRMNHASRRKVARSQNRDTSGVIGSTGAQGDIGIPGSNGTPDPSPPGGHGVCGVDPNGGDGFPGNAGGTGGKGEQGLMGGRGGDAGAQNNQITNATGTYNFYANGGEGGQGGKGGQGGFGGTGARGGTAGNGADCSCNQGGAGNGGTGGPGGKGGKGGREE